VRGIQEAARTHSVVVNVGIHVPVPVREPGSVSDWAAKKAAASPSSGSSSATTATTAATTVTKLLNRSLWVDADGSINDAASYDKLHLFDYGSLRESATVQAGRSLTPPFATPVGRVGSLVCFDLRFPEVALALARPGPRSAFAAAPAQILTFPSAFTVRTGSAHWEVLLRARAVETQSWVVAAAQVGRHNAKRASYGHSMVVDPWGEVVLELGGVVERGEKEGTASLPEAEDGAEGAIGFVDVDLARCESVRQQMPLVRRT
jgi:predicted amidohydrolase